MTTNAVFELDADLREELGTGPSRRLRRIANKTPGIVYGGNEAATPILVEHKKILKAIENEAFYSSILTLNIKGNSQKVVLKDLQRHPHKPVVLHMDFQRIKISDVITMRVPIHFTGENSCPGVKQGGIINHQAVNVEIKCRADKLPEFLEIDLSALELDQSLHLSDLKLPESIEIPSLSQNKEANLPIVSVHMPRQGKITEEEEKAEDNKDKEAAASEKTGDKDKVSKDKDKSK